MITEIKVRFVCRRYSIAWKNIRLAVSVALTLSTGFIPATQSPASAQTTSDHYANSEPDRDIVFPNKSYISGQAYVAVQGTLTADWLAYPNNTYSIVCDMRQCLVASVEQIGARQIGAIQGPIVSKWSNAEVIAESDDVCARTAIVINRAEQTVFWVQTPINQSTGVCQSFQPVKPRTATIEAPAFWNWTKSK